MDPIIIISCDEHTGPALDAYRRYLEAKYHKRLDEQKAASQATLLHLKHVAYQTTRPNSTP